MSRPEVDARRQADGKDVGGRPVDEVEVEVVLQVGCVENFEWAFWNFTDGLSRAFEQFFGVGGNWRQRKTKKLRF